MGSRTQTPGGGQVVLDTYNSDLHLSISSDGLSAETLNSPEGFRLLWGGARATHGVCRGKVMFEVKVARYLPSNVSVGFSEPHPNLVRVGWSEDGPSFALGEGGESYGYGGSGKFSYKNSFDDYGEPFKNGDVITALLDLDSSPGTIAFMKNGRHLGIAHCLSGSGRCDPSKALFPHVYCKNAEIKVNFGQVGPWSLVPVGYTFIGLLPPLARTRGLEPPASKSSCEMIMLIGLPGSGKTTWALHKQETRPRERFNILGSDALIDKFKVMGLVRHSGYSERFEQLYKRADKCLETLLAIAAGRARNYILDQTNVFPKARSKKMLPFSDFRRTAVVIQPEIGELERRSSQRTKETGKNVPNDVIRKMKANFILPEERDMIFERIEYVGLDKESTQKLVIRYNREDLPHPPCRNSHIPSPPGITTEALLEIYDEGFGYLALRQVNSCSLPGRCEKRKLSFTSLHYIL
ncbi:Heteroproteinous nuclear ribonucleoprotein U-like protein 1 [Bulinus truncatus]|nr:Heteroproteinous nuclear ribonucleoprotein U-like protein 1 [Bulinus truncatus]